MAVFLRIVAVFLMIAAGAAARRRRLLDAESTGHLSRLVVAMFYPALIYSTLVTAFTFRDLLHHWTLPAGALLIMSIGFAAGLLGVRLLRFSSKAAERTFHFQCTINNYSFLPMPIIFLLWGKRGVADLIFSTVGSEIAVWTLGMLALTGGRLRWSSLRHLVTPPMLAIAAAAGTLAAVDVSGVEFPPPGVFGEAWKALISALDLFGKATVPLAMLVAGSRMSELRLRHLWGRPQIAAVLLRTVAAPACAVAILLLLPLAAPVREVLLVVAVMPCAIASVMLSDVYGGDSDFAAATVLTSHVVGLATIPIWLSLLL
jgi:predicted permease